MGDRGNVVVQFGDASKRIWFYTHWRGSDLPSIVQRGLVKAKSRWDDYSYFARIIFNELQGDDRGTTGFGIGLELGDNEHPIITVDPTTKWVQYQNKKWTFDDFINSSPARIAFSAGDDDEVELPD